VLLWVHNVNNHRQGSAINVKVHWIDLVSLAENLIIEIGVLIDSILLFNRHQERVQNEYMFVDLMESPAQVEPEDPRDVRLGEGAWHAIHRRLPSGSQSSIDGNLEPLRHGEIFQGNELWDELLLLLLLFFPLGLFLVQAALHWRCFILFVLLIRIFFLLLVLFFLRSFLQSEECFLPRMNLRILRGREDLQCKEVVVPAFKAEGRGWHVIGIQLVEGEVALINQSQDKIIRTHIFLIELSGLLCNLLLDGH